jgi:hypothetical protein
MITQKQIKRLLHYNPRTGIFTWLERKPDMFEDGKMFSKEIICNQWNAKWAGKEAGCLSHGYISIGINNRKYGAHILAYIYMTGKQPNKDIDHNNRNRNDNSWINLRPANNSQNRANSKIYENNTSGFKGVTLHGNKYQAQIQVNNKNIYLGRFNTAEEAHKAYCEAAEKYFGKFARTA